MPSAVVKGRLQSGRRVWLMPLVWGCVPGLGLDLPSVALPLAFLSSSQEGPLPGSLLGPPGPDRRTASLPSGHSPLRTDCICGVALPGTPEGSPIRDMIAQRGLESRQDTHSRALPRPSRSPPGGLQARESPHLPRLAAPGPWGAETEGTEAVLLEKVATKSHAHDTRPPRGRFSPAGSAGGQAVRLRCLCLPTPPASLMAPDPPAAPRPRLL